MTTSGTLHQTTFDTATVLEHALRRCKLSPAAINAELLKLAEDSLYLFLVSLQTKGVHLWCLQRELVGLESGVLAYPLVAGAHDAKEVYYRTPTLLGGTTSSATDQLKIELTTAATVRLVGVLGGVSGTYPLAVEASSDGAAWTTLQTVVLELTANTYSWFEVTAPAAGLHLRVRDTSTAGTLVGALVVAAQWSDRELTRESRDRYAYSYRPHATNPSMFWVDRGASITTIWLDRAPSSATDLLWVWYRRNVQDVGDLKNDLDVPRHWLPATISGTALLIALELPEELMSPQRLQLLAAMAGQDLQAVEDEEYDESDIEFDLDLQRYTS